MILVAGLAVAGLIVVAAAFYFSLRMSGNRRRSTAGPSRARTSRASAASRTPADRSAREATAERTSARTGRNRVGFRKGSDIDEELWPTEAFGGVSDDQFWDDMASDKPLTTTARTAQPDATAKPRPARAAAPSGSREPQRGTYQPAPTAPVAAAPASAVPTASMPTMPAPTMPAPTASVSTGPTQGTPFQGAPRGATPPQGTARRRIDPDDDPLTSSAFSLRSSGPVDGRSRLRLSPEQYEAAVSQDTQSYGPPPGSYDRRPARQAPPSGPQYRDQDPVRRQTPPTSYPQAAPSQPRARHAQGNGTGEWGTPDDRGYPGTDQQANGSYRANGYHGGHRGQHDPRDDYRRLTG